MAKCSIESLITFNSRTNHSLDVIAHKIKPIYMKITRNILILTFIVLSISCTKNSSSSEKQEVVITGKIHQYNGKDTRLYFWYSQPGVKDSKELLNIDAEGNFEYQIEGYIPLDAMLFEGNTFANINFIYHPGDSIHIEFEAKDKELALLKTVKFSGDRDKTNNQIINFQTLRKKNKLGYEAINQGESNKKSTTDFILEMNLVKEKQLKMYKAFVDEYSPTDEAKIWAKLFALETYYYYLDRYGEGKENLPENYYDYTKEILPITNDKFICWKVLESRIMAYTQANIFTAFSKQYPNIDLMNSFTDKTSKSDSLFLNLAKDYSSDDMLNQLVISELYKSLLLMNSLDSYNRNLATIKTELSTPFLFKSLSESFEKTTEYLKSPKERTALLLKKMEGSPIEETFNKILNENKGKVIYIDCWGTNCRPCIKEMPDSKKLMSKFKEQDMAFVYMCLNGNEQKWKKLLLKFKLDGSQQYLLDNKQSQSIRDIMQFNGIPYHILIDKNGAIIESGYGLRPSMKSTEVKIAGLVNE